ncbi:hypothetical protein GCM10009738_40980 [Kitasatospora viridis]
MVLIGAASELGSTGAISTPPGWFAVTLSTELTCSGTLQSADPVALNEYPSFFASAPAPHFMVM